MRGAINLKLTIEIYKTPNEPRECHEVEITLKHSVKYNKDPTKEPHCCPGDRRHMNDMGDGFPCEANKTMSKVREIGRKDNLFKLG